MHNKCIVLARSFFIKINYYLGELSLNLACDDTCRTHLKLSLLVIERSEEFIIADAYPLSETFL